MGDHNLCLCEYNKIDRIKDKVTCLENFNFSVGTESTPINYYKLELTDVTPERNTEEATIPFYGPYYNCRINFTINSFDTDWFNIFEIGDGTKNNRHPALYISPSPGNQIHGYSYRESGARSKFNELNTPYIVEMSQKDVNGDVKFSFIFNEIERITYMNVRDSAELAVKTDAKVFFSNNFNPAADVTIHSFFFESWSCNPNEGFSGSLCNECISGYYYTADERSCTGIF